MNKDQFIKEIEDYIRDSDKLLSEDEEYVRGWKSAWLLALELAHQLDEKDIHELTLDEWREWKDNKKHDPICLLWEHDTSPMWVLNPKDIHEPALLMGQLKLFTGRLTPKQCVEIKWGNKNEDICNLEKK